MSLPPIPVRVMADGRDVVCTSCGEAWSRGLGSVDEAAALARRMNCDPLALVPNRVRHGLCHGTGAGSQWEDIAPTVDTPPDWRDRLVVSRDEGSPEQGRPAWATIALGGLAVAWSAGRAPAVLGRGVLALGRVPLPVVIALALVAAAVLRVPGFGVAAAGFLLSVVVVAVVLLAVVLTAAGLYAWARHPAADPAQVPAEDARG